MLSDYCASIDERISRDKILVEKKMPSQFRSWIVKPLQEIVKQGKRVQPKAIFINGLSNCAGGDAQAGLFSSIVSKNYLVHPLKWKPETLTT